MLWGTAWTGIRGGKRIEVVEAPEELDFVEHAAPGHGGESFDEALPGDVGEAALDGDVASWERAAAVNTSSIRRRLAGGAAESMFVPRDRLPGSTGRHTPEMCQVIECSEQIGRNG